MCSSDLDPVRDQVLALFSATFGATPDQAWALGFGPPLTSLLDLNVTSDEVVIAWRSQSSAGRDAVVERRGDSGLWAQLAYVQFDATGTLTFDDRAVYPGQGYAYRLGILEGGITWYTDSTSIEIPVRPLFALRGVRPNPSSGTFELVFSLPDAEAARIEVFDVRGRRVLARDVGGLGIGPHTVTLNSGHGLAPGVYLVRLERARESRTMRAVVLR